MGKSTDQHYYAVHSLLRQGTLSPPSDVVLHEGVRRVDSDTEMTRLYRPLSQLLKDRVLREPLRELVSALANNAS